MKPVTVFLLNIFTKYYDYDIFNGNKWWTLLSSISVRSAATFIYSNPCQKSIYPPSGLFGHPLVLPFDSCLLTRLIRRLQLVGP